MSIDFYKVMNEKKLDKNTFYLILSGDREFQKDCFTYMKVDDTVKAVAYQDILNDAVSKLIKKRLDNGFTIKIITGDNGGADKLAEEYGTVNNMDVIIFPADWDELGNRAGFERNEDMFFYVGRRENKGAIVFWNGENYYTRNIIYQAYMFGTTIRVYHYKERRWLSSEEIKTIQYDERNKQLLYKRRQNNENNE